MSDAALLQPRRVALAALLHLPPDEQPAPAPPAVPTEQLLAERDAAHAAALAEQQARIAALEAALEATGQQHQAQLAETRACAVQLFAGLETLLAAELAALAHATAQAVLAAEPSLSPETLASLIADAVHGLPRGALHLPPSAMALAGPLCPEGWALRVREGLPDGAVEAEAGPALQHQSLAARLSALFGATS